MKSKQMCGVVLALFMGLFSVGNAQAAVISLTSGTGVVGATDPNITMLVGSAFGLTAPAFTAADFAAAAAGANAFIVAPHPQWVAATATMAGAQWVSTAVNGSANLATVPTGSGNNALYAISFNLTSVALTSAVLNLTAYADNTLGTVINSGMFINGVAIAGSTGANSTGYLIGSGVNLTNVNILSSLKVGVNTLYFNVVNTIAGPSGLLFNASLTTTPSVAAVPAPGVLGLLALGLLLLVMFGNNKQGMFPLTKKQ